MGASPLLIPLLFTLTVGHPGPEAPHSAHSNSASHSGSGGQRESPGAAILHISPETPHALAELLPMVLPASRTGAFEPVRAHSLGQPGWSLPAWAARNQARAIQRENEREGAFTALWLLSWEVLAAQVPTVGQPPPGSAFFPGEEDEEDDFSPGPGPDWSDGRFRTYRPGAQ